MKNICVVGLGYIGLPTATLLANSGFQVLGVDVSPRVVESINKGIVHIAEPDLEQSMVQAVKNGSLRANSVAGPADVFMVCVPTPFSPAEGDPVPDVSLVLSAARSIAKFLQPGNLVILESTSPVGTTQRLSDVLAECGCDVASLHIAYCPERVLPGKIMKEIVENDRVVGGLNDESTKRVSAFYRKFVSGAVLETNAPTAEMCKLAENSFRDVNIAFANELSMICAGQNINVWELISLANRHPRVNILQPGIGVGGHCIAVDPWFLVASDPMNAGLTRMGRNVNNRKTQWVIQKIERAVEKYRSEFGRLPVIACYGLSFKPNSDDLRESPALEIVNTLRKAGHNLVAVEPNISSHPYIKILAFEDAVSNADIHLLLVSHQQFTTEAAKKLINSVAYEDYCGLLG